MEVSTHIIVCHSTPEVRLQATSFTQEATTINLITTEETRLAIKYEVEVVACKAYNSFFHIVTYLHLILYNRLHLWHWLPRLHLHLHFCYSLSSCHQWFSSLQLKVDIQEYFTVKLLTNYWQSIFNCLLWCNIQFFNRTILNNLTLINKAPFHTIVA